MKTITRVTHKFIFGTEPPDKLNGQPGTTVETDEAEFIENYGQLDVFLDEVFTSARTASWSGQDNLHAVDHKTKVKHVLRQQRPDSDRKKDRVTRKNQPEKSITAGTVIRDRYEVKSYIGRGGNGIVYKGLDKQLSRFVAIKVLIIYHV